ncbi:MAG: phosphatase PAP2 family protein [Patescibacteria group bacterium]
MNLDYLIFNCINQFAGRNAILDNLGIFFAKYFEYFLIFLLLSLLVKNFKKYYLMTIRAFGAAILSRFVITDIIRWFWYRPRPFVENSVNLLVNHPAEASFPSGHAAFYFALSTAVYLHNKKLGIFFLISTFLITFSRVFVGVHWPSDILAGAIIGIFSGWLANKLYKRFLQPKTP